MTTRTLLLTLQDPHDTSPDPGEDHQGEITGENYRESLPGESPGEITCFRIISLGKQLTENANQRSHGFVLPN